MPTFRESAREIPDGGVMYDNGRGNFPAAVALYFGSSLPHSIFRCSDSKATGRVGLLVEGIFRNGPIQAVAS